MKERATELQRARRLNCTDEVKEVNNRKRKEKRNEDKAKAERKQLLDKQTYNQLKTRGKHILSKPYKTGYIFRKKKNPTQVQQYISPQELMDERDPTGRVRQTRQQDILERAQALKSTAPDIQIWCKDLGYRAQFNFKSDITSDTPFEKIQSYLESDPEFDILNADKLLSIRSTVTFNALSRSCKRSVDVSQFLTTDFTLYKFLTSDYKLYSKK